MCTQALHTLCLTEPALGVPAEDPERFCRTLAPYIKAGASDRHAAEQLMCIIYILVRLPPSGHASPTAVIHTGFGSHTGLRW